MVKVGGFGMKAAEVMNSEVISVSPTASVGEVAGVLLRHGISAVPVIGERGELAGMVSEGDLIRAAEGAAKPRPSWWLKLLADNEEVHLDAAKIKTRTVAEVMTQKVITATPETPVSHIAAWLQRYSIKRVPVVKNGKVVGIVSRADLLKAVANVPSRADEAAVVWG
jgi:CBS domain-containing protein